MKCTDCGKPGFALHCYNKRWRQSNPEKQAKHLRDTAARRRSKNPEEFKRQEAARSKAWRNREFTRLKAEVYLVYGPWCNCCGEKEPLFLSLDHVDNNGNTERKVFNSLQLLKKIVREGFPKTYQILCMNCNHGKHRNGGTCPHKSRVLRL
jgi:hypothetical protein